MVLAKALKHIKNNYVLKALKLLYIEEYPVIYLKYFS